MITPAQYGRRRGPPQEVHPDARQGRQEFGYLENKTLPQVQDLREGFY